MPDRSFPRGHSVRVGRERRERPEAQRGLERAHRGQRGRDACKELRRQVGHGAARAGPEHLLRAGSAGREIEVSPRASDTSGYFRTDLMLFTNSGRAHNPPGDADV